MMSDTFLHYTRQGAGPPLLLLHGNGEDGSYFVHQMGAFSLHYTVYAIDTRGHGKLAAWPRFNGRTAFSFSLASSRRPWMAA